MEQVAMMEQSKNQRMSILAKRPFAALTCEISGRNSFFVIALSLLFAVSFALPLIFAIKVGSLLYSDRESTDEHSRGSNFLSRSPLVSQPNSFLKINASRSLLPQEGKDFIFLLWVRPKKLPAPGERVVIMSKVDNESASRSGYALALQRETTGVKPFFYWRDRKGDGTWLSFSEIELVPRAWLMLALSFREARYLGMHGAVVVEQLKPELKLLGGYELEKRIFPSSESNLLVGSHGNGIFRGEIGPIGIFSADSFTDRLESLFNSALVKPEEVPADLSSEEVMLWTIDGKNDSSNIGNTVEFIKPKRGDK